MRYFMTFSYDGTAYKGYQRQPKKKTIQEEIENCLYQLNGANQVTIHASGRTDAHVHAYGQTAHFDLQKEWDTCQLKYSLNQMLPKDIYIIDMKSVDFQFHARFDVKAKEYIYKINIGEYDPFQRHYVYQYNHDLDISKIMSATHYLEGTHNFKAFTKVDDEKENYNRTIYKISLHCENQKLIISFLGDGFLRYMIRNIVGTLIEIGECKRKSEDIVTILESEDRKQAGKTAPPEGLYLNQVYYKDIRNNC